MDDDEENSGFVTANTGCREESASAVNSLILEYYKKFGRKRDLEQYFSLSTAQGDLRDPTGTFWRKMKSENDSSDSGERKSESSQEVCRISIRCSTVPEATSSKEYNDDEKAESVSPPIIIEEVQQDNNDRYSQLDKTFSHSDEDYKSEDNQSQKSYDVLLDTSTNKPLSPSSSITSQRKLEWDSLADVGYGNESDRKTSASSLSTLEKLALKQQYSYNDTGSLLGAPTAHSTPQDENEVKSKVKKGLGKKSTKIYKKDVDLVEVNVPHSSNNNPPQSINVNLTKHISFNVEKDGKVTVQNIEKDVSVSPEKKSVEAGISPVSKVDREIQTSLVRTKEADSSPEIPKKVVSDTQKIPIMISLNTLRKRVRRKRLRKARKKLRSLKSAKENIALDKSGEQLSEAESFEYMPGHIYNQNQLQANATPNMAGNKSSLESSGALTTDSSKASKISFSQDLKKSIEVLRHALRDRCDDATLRKKLIKQVCEKLVNSKYKNDNSSSDFLSGLSFSSNKLGLRQRDTTTSTSDNNDSVEKRKPKKSILRNDKFNPGAIASTSQSAPNLPIASTSERPVTSNLVKPLVSSNTDSELSGKEKNSSDNVYDKTSSEELYKKYLEALSREQAYKRHLKDKEMFMKQKLVCSDSAFKVPARSDTKVNERLKDLIKDLTRNNYADGSGDASNLEGGPNSNSDFNRPLPIRSQRSHSVFTLSSGNSETRKPNLKKRSQCEPKDDPKPSTSKEKHYCCCPHHSSNVHYGVTDSSVQVNVKIPYSGDSSLERPVKPRELSPRLCSRAESPTCKKTKPENQGDVKYVCLCNNKVIKDVPDNFFLYKCSRVPPNEDNTKSFSLQSNHNCIIPCSAQNEPSTSKAAETCIALNSKSSQTNCLTKILRRKSSDRSLPTKGVNPCQEKQNSPRSSTRKIYEATRCLQTEITIDPKIQDPSKSDICIVSDSHCCRLVSENCRIVSKTTVTGQGTSSNTSSRSNTSTKSTGTSKKFKNFALDDFDSALKFNDEESENYTIPIQGTNMTLMVSIGSKERKNDHMVEEDSDENMVEMKSAHVGTETALQAEQGTSLTEECSKGVQYNITSKAKANDSSSDRCKSKPTKKPTKEDPAKSSTYPRSPVNERKPFIRSNTDTNNLTIKPETTDKKSIKSSSSSNKSRNSLLNSCICGCMEKGCDSKCKAAKNKTSCLSPRSLNTDKSNSPVKKSRSPSIASSVKCECGCSVKDCNNQCKDVSKNSSCKSTMYVEEVKTDDKPNCNHGSLNTGCQINEPQEPEENRNRKETEAQTVACVCGCAVEHCDNKCNTGGDSKNNACVERPFSQNVCVCGCAVQDCNNKCKENDKGASNCSTANNQVIEKIEMTSVGVQCVCGCNVTGCDNKCADGTNKNTGDCNPAVTKNQSQNSCDKATSTGDQPCICGCNVQGCNNKCKAAKQGRSCSPKSTDSNKSVRSKASDKQSKGSCVCGCNVKDCDNKCKAAKQAGESTKNASCGTKSRPSSPCPIVKDKTSKPCSCGCTVKDCNNQCSVDKGTGDCSPKDSLRNSGSRPGSACPVVKENKSSNKCSANKETGDSSCNSGSRPSSGRKVCKETIGNPSCICGCADKSCNNKCKAARSNDGYSKSDTDSQKCSCGCPNYKGDCKESCSQRSDSKRKEIGVQKNKSRDPSRSPSRKTTASNSPSRKNNNNRGCQTSANNSDKPTSSKKIENTPSGSESEPLSSDPIMDMIKNITKRYSKSDIEKSKRKKCFKEIINVLNYLLETETPSDCNKENVKKPCETSSTPVSDFCAQSSGEVRCEKSPKRLVDRAIQMCPKKCKSRKCSEFSSDIPCTSTDSTTCKVLNKIRKECERYHQKRCKNHGKKCDLSSTTSVNCDRCRKTHYCHCRYHKCKLMKKCSENSKKPVAYNLIIQTSESLMSEEPSLCQSRQLKNIIVKVPPKKRGVENMPFKELEAKIECGVPPCGPMKKEYRSKSMPNESELSSFDELLRKTDNCTVRDYLERNRPDFVENCSQRQNCLKFISGSRASERAVKRDVLSMRVAQLSNVNEMDSQELLELAKDIGKHIRNKQPAPKLISEREMKKHSENIYKKLPEVVRKREEQKKENEKKTNLLMANMFKKNLQKKTLRGSVNLSNYSPVVKI